MLSREAGMLKVRHPRFDFSTSGAHWSSNREYAQQRNADSTVPSMIEPYLIKVLQRAKGNLGEADGKLLSEIDWFIAQESQHFRQHMAFNLQLAADGYDKIPHFEKTLRRDLRGFLDNKSLKFNIAYSEGFESLGAASAEVIFRTLDHLHGSVAPDAAQMWKWHLAEEFEHRCVMYDLYKRLYGGGLTRGYFGRIHGFFYAFIHLTRFLNSVKRYLLEEDRRGMSPAEVKASRRQEAANNRMVAYATLPRLVLVLLPWYNPLRKKAPSGLYEYLAQFEPGGPRAGAPVAT
jgi:predicted metal-dependent hydrolase